MTVRSGGSPGEICIQTFEILLEGLNGGSIREADVSPASLPCSASAAEETP